VSLTGGEDGWSPLGWLLLRLGGSTAEGPHLDDQDVSAVAEAECWPRGEGDPGKFLGQAHPHSALGQNLEQSRDSYSMLLQGVSEQHFSLRSWGPRGQEEGRGAI
jgi:hypothetical protein